jgi:Subtilase family
MMSLNSLNLSTYGMLAGTFLPTLPTDLSTANLIALGSPKSKPQKSSEPGRESTHKPVSNWVMHNGFAVNRMPTQENLARAPETGSAYDKLKPGNLGIKVFVMDDYQTNTIAIGNGALTAAYSHGLQSLAIVKQQLPGVSVTGVNVAENDGAISSRRLAVSIDEIVASEAKKQNTKYPKLGHVFVSASLGDTSLVPDAVLQAAIAKFTAAGGTFVASAGNERQNNNSTSNNVVLVAATSALVGSKQSNAPMPARHLLSGFYATPKTGLINYPVPHSSVLVLAPGTMTQRFNDKTGEVDRLTERGWVPLIQAQDVAKNKAVYGDLEGRQPGLKIPAEAVQRFFTWQKDLVERTLQARGPVITPATGEKPLTSRPANLSDLNANELTTLNNRFMTEYDRRFGANAVISSKDYIAFLKTFASSEDAAKVEVATPKIDGVGSADRNTYLSGRDVLARGLVPQQNSAVFYRLDANNRLVPVPSLQSMETSSSAATPDATVRIVLHRVRTIRALEAKNSKKAPAH